MAMPSYANIVNLLAGVRYRLSEGTFVGVAYLYPITDAYERLSQIVVQLDFIFGTSTQ